MIARRMTDSFRTAIIPPSVPREWGPGRSIFRRRRLRGHFTPDNRFVLPGFSRQAHLEETFAAS